jgi:hypothetical chaperone protein
MNSLEIAKIALSEKEQITLPLYYIQDELSAPFLASDMRVSLEDWFSSVFDLIDIAIEDMEEKSGKPTHIYLTGGMSLSPIVLSEINNRYSDYENSTGDAFSSITNGAAIFAHKIFGGAVSYS